MDPMSEEEYNKGLMKRIEEEQKKKRTDEEELCGFFGCKSEFDSDTWEHVEFHSCKRGGTVHTSICGECFRKIFEDEW